MQPYDVARFYRLGSTRFSLVWVARSSHVGFTRSESWQPASASFAVPLGIVARADGGYSETYTGVYPAGLLGEPSRLDPMGDVAAPVWQANKASSDAVLTAAVNAALIDAGYTRPSGAAIA